MAEVDVDAYRKFQARQDQLANRKNRIMISFFALIVASGALATSHYGGGASTAAFFLAALSYALGYFYSDTDATMQAEHQKHIQETQE